MQGAASDFQNSVSWLTRFLHLVLSPVPEGRWDQTVQNFIVAHLRFRAQVYRLCGARRRHKVPGNVGAHPRRIEVSTRVVIARQCQAMQLRLSNHTIVMTYEDRQGSLPILRSTPALVVLSAVPLPVGTRCCPFSCAVALFQSIEESPFRVCSPTILLRLLWTDYQEIPQ